MPVKCENPNCEYLNRTLPNNANVCPMCGQPVGNVVRRAPDAPATRGIVPPAPPPVPLPPVRPSRRTARPALKLLHSSGREFAMRQEKALLGRPKGDDVPDIDLSGIPNDKVVSRQHAEICWDAAAGAYTITDKKSANGTYLNNQSLAPGTPYQLTNGAMLHLGKDGLMQFTVAIG